MVRVSDVRCSAGSVGWPARRRLRSLGASAFGAGSEHAGQGEREKMMMGALGALIADVAPQEKPYITRGVREDKE